LIRWRCHNGTKFFVIYVNFKLDLTHQDIINLRFLLAFIFDDLRFINRFHLAP